MGITAENLADKYGITRLECDEFALCSQDRWANGKLIFIIIIVLCLANKNGYFNAEIIPVEVKGKRGMETVTCDEHPRQTTIEKLATLPPIFKENGTVTAGNASVICTCKRKLSLLSLLLLLGYL